MMTQWDPNDPIDVKIVEHLNAGSWMLMAVGGDADHDPFLYTVGLAERGAPELLVAAPGNNAIGALTNEVAQRVLDGQRAGYVDLGGIFPVLLAPVTDAARDACMTYAGHRVCFAPFDALQIVLPDPKGRFPFAEGCAMPFRTQRCALPDDHPNAWSPRLVTDAQVTP